MLDKSDQSLKLPDQTALKFGSGSNFSDGDLDVKMWHNGTGFNIRDYTSAYITLATEQANGYVQIRANNGNGTNTSPYFTASGSSGEAILYHASSIHLVLS